MLFPVMRNHFLPLLACPCDSPTGFIGFIEFIWFIRMKPFSSICSYHVFFPIIHPQCFSCWGLSSQEATLLKPGHTSHLTSCPVVFWGFPCLPAGDMDWGTIATSESGISGLGSSWFATLRMQDWLSELVVYQRGRLEVPSYPHSNK